MARKRYTDEEIIGQLRTIEIDFGNESAVPEACRKLGITEQNCGTTYSTGNSSTRDRRHGSLWKVSGNVIPRNDRIVHWDIGYPPQRPARSRQSPCRREGT